MRLLRALFGRSAPSPTAAAAPDAAPAQPLIPWQQMGETAFAARNLPEAARCFEQAVAAQPQDPTLRFRLGTVLLELGRAADAAEKLRQALALARPGEGPARHEVHLQLGRAEMQLQDPEDAFEQFEAAVRVLPGYPAALEEGARALHALRRDADAVEWADRLLQLRPDSANGWLLRHLALVRLNRFEEALAAADSALAITGPNPLLLVNRAVPLERLGRSDEALASIDRALALDPKHREARGNRIPLLLGMLRLDDAIAAAQDLLRDNPEDANVHMMLGIARMLQGDLQEGWPHLEWRTRSAAFSRGTALQLQQPRWRGESLEGKTIFLHSEQGFGDNIQFLRFVPQVARLARTVLLLVNDNLESLVMGALPPNCRLVPQRSVLPPIDFQCPLMSVPAVLGVTLQTLPAAVPYLRANASAVQAWRQRLGAGGLRVGIAWAGNPSHVNDRNRSMPLAAMQALAGVEGCRFVTVQPKAREDDAAALAAWPGIVDLGRDLRDFAETAALIEALDLVITVDTAVAHLAGALGKPVWILLPHVPDWRWMLEREDSPWYPTARLFRQPAAGDWGSVLARVREELRKLAATAPA